MTSISKVARTCAAVAAIALSPAAAFAQDHATDHATDHAQEPATGHAQGHPADHPQEHGADHKDGTGHGEGNGKGQGHGDGTGSGVDHAKGESPGRHAPASHGSASEHAPAGAGAGAGHPADGEHEGEHHAGHDEHGPPAPINWADFSKTDQPPYVALLLNFAILLGIYFYFGKKPVADGLKKRRAEIAKEIEEAQRIKQEAEERAKMYQAKLATLETELAQARQALVESGKGERDRIIREAEERAARMAKDAQLLLEQELKQMKVDLVRETVAVAISAAEELLRSNVTHADQERLADDFLRDLSAKTSSRPSTSSNSNLGGAS